MSGRSRSSGPSKGGLELSRTTKGIQNTRRSFRGLGKGGAPTLSDELAKVDTKRRGEGHGGGSGGRSGGGGGGGKRPTLADDLSIDESVLSDRGTKKGNRRQSRGGGGPPLLGGRDSDSSSEDESVGGVGRDNNNRSSRRRTAENSSSNLGSSGSRRPSARASTSRDSLRIPPRKASGGRRVGGSGMNELSRSDHGRSTSADNRKPTMEDDLSMSRSDHNPRPRRHRSSDDLSMSRSDHNRSSTSKSDHHRSSGSGSRKSSSGSRRRAGGGSGMNELSRSDHERSASDNRRRMEDDLSMSRSDHNRQSSSKKNRDDLSMSRSDHNRSAGGKALMRRCKSVSSAESKQHAVKGIYKLLDSLENKDSSRDTTKEATKEKEGLGSDSQTKTRRTQLRKSLTSDGLQMAQAMGRDTVRKQSIQGIRNLLDKDTSNREVNMKDRSSNKDGSSRHNRSSTRGRRKPGGSDSDSDSDVSEKGNRSTRAKGEDFGTNHRASLHGIHKLLGTMGKDATVNSKEKDKVPDRESSVDRIQKNRRSRSSRRLKSHQQLTEEEEPTAKHTAISKDEEAASSSKRNKEEEAASSSRAQTRKDSSSRKPDGKGPPTLPITDDDDENDYDSVATPKTATGPPPPPMKEAPPPPQRRNIARKPRNMLPNVAPQKPPKPSSGSYKSAPPEVPATPMRSPGGLVVDMQNSKLSTPVAGCTTPQQNLSTPTMPIVPNNGFDSVSTPQTQKGDVVGVGPPPVTSNNAPPPPPKRNMDMGSRWKNRQNKMPTMPGQQPTTPGGVPSTPAQRAPVMSMLSPGGIVIEVNCKKTGLKGPNRPPEPMTPMAEMTPMGSKSGLLSNSPHYSGLRNSLPPCTPGGQQSHSGHGSWMNTPSNYSNSGDISELTPGTFVSQRMTPGGRGGTPRGQVPSTPSLYNSPGVISELTPGGYSVGLMGDDDYIPSDGGAYPMTPRTFGILLEEDNEDDGVAHQGETQTAAMPSTPSLASPAGVVSEMTPGSYGMIDLNCSTDTTRRLPQVEPLHVPTTPSVNNDSNAGIVSELTPGSYNVVSAYGRKSIPTTPSVNSPAGVVTDSGSTNEGSIRNIRMLSNLSNHSGVVSDITPGSFSTSAGGSTAGQVSIAG